MKKHIIPAQINLDISTFYKLKSEITEIMPDDTLPSKICLDHAQKLGELTSQQASMQKVLDEIASGLKGIQGSFNELLQQLAVRNTKMEEMLVASVDVEKRVKKLEEAVKWDRLSIRITAICTLVLVLMHVESTAQKIITAVFKTLSI